MTQRYPIAQRHLLSNHGLLSHAAATLTRYWKEGPNAESARHESRRREERARRGRQPRASGEDEGASSV